MRTLHTFKGGARLAGAMRLGEMAHRLETAIEHLLARGQVEAADVEALLARVDSITTGFEQLGQPAEAAPAIPAARANQAAQLAEAAAQLAEAAAQTAQTAQTAQAAQAAQTAQAAQAAQAVQAKEAADAADAAVGGAAEAVPAAQPAGVSPAAPAEPPAAPSPPVPMPAAAAPPAPPRPPAAAAASRSIDWSRFAVGSAAAVPQPAADRAGSAQAAVRVRAPLLDRLVNQAGEVSITRARIESDVGQIRGSLGDLTENLDRLRRQLRDLELQAESQIASRMEAAKAAAQAFDPLEMDRFTRFQELTRMMAESVNDVATVHRGLQRSLQATEDELASQARLTRDLQDDLLRTRMVEFESLADRLYRVVRQAAKETGKQVRLDIAGGAIEVDRGVLDRMTAPFEHLLRNSVAHGIEAPAQRQAAGKDAAGAITISLAQEGNEVAVEFRDDGAGLDLDRIRRRAVAQGLLAEGAQPGDAELANLIFAPGFSTADNVSELAGRGVGMDVVRAEVNAMGGRIETATAAGQGASFRLVLPLTTAVTQVVMLRCGGLDVAVPSTLVEQVRRVPAAELEQAYAGAGFAAGERVLPFFWLGALLRADARGPAAARMATVVIVRSAAQRVALHVDEVLGNQEVVVKNLGPQLARLPGLAGVTLLPSGAVALIYNPVALAATYGDAARAAQRRQPAADQPAAAAPAEARAPLVLVVDDSLTVRRVTQRLLEREGYRVALAKDGLDALEKLADELPAVVLSDIEMPRMDGFDLVRNLRADARLAQLPVIMITSRIAQKHRDYAARLGVDHYLGKPYAEDELLSLVARCAQEAAVTA
ncbi:MAG TPA: response regulator, partial [Rubrivivax sp.]|nr:response regulator [Rubrivivax sp.]